MVAQIDKRYVARSLKQSAVRLLSYALYEGRPLTTRGRWINPLVFARARAVARGEQRAPVEKPVFIIGTGRSGTTVLGVVLSLHQKIGFLNEPKAMWHTAFANEDLPGNYTTAPARYRLDAEDADRQTAETMQRLYGGYLSTSRTTRVLDKYPELIFRVPFVRQIFPDARFLFLARNGEDTISSITAWSQRHGERSPDETVDWWGTNNRKWHCLVEQLVAEDPLFAGVADEIAALTSHTDMAAVEWILSMQEGRRLVEQLPDAVLEVRYEDLVSLPVETLGNIMKFCELEPDAAVFNYATEILEPGRRQSQPAELHPAVQEPFEKIMQVMGYRQAGEGAGG